MRFPEWVTAPKSKKAQATNRIRFILMNLALHHSKGGTVAALARELGIGHYTISKAIHAGRFSVKTAWTFQQALGREVVTVEQLTQPLEIPTTK
jgi:hypothetical protein